MRTEEKLIKIKNKRDMAGSLPAGYTETGGTRRPGKGVKTAGTVLFFIFIFIYMPSLYYWIFKRDVRTAVMQIGSIEESVTVDGMLSRSEEIIYSSVEGECVYLAGEGERVPAGYKAGSVLNGDTSMLARHLTLLKEEILALKLEAITGNRIYSGNLLKIDSEIAEKVRLLAAASEVGSLGAASRLAVEIDGLILKKTELALNGNDPGTALIRDKETEADSLQREMDRLTGAIYTYRSGIISFIHDGCEEILRPDLIRTFTPVTFDNAWKAYSPSNMYNGRVSAGKPFARLVTDYCYYLLFVLDKTYEGYYDYYGEGSAIRIRIKDRDIVINGQVSFISSVFTDGRKLFAVRTYEGTDTVSAIRKIKADIIRNYYTGIKIPLKSLIDIDTAKGTARIIMVEANYSKIRDVVIKGMDNEYAVIENPAGTASGKGISLYASYVVNPGNIKEGQLIIK